VESRDEFGIRIDGDTMNIAMGKLDAVDASPPTPKGWRDGVTFPVELEEAEGKLLDDVLRELKKINRALNKFIDKRKADAEFAASLTDDERQMITQHRANVGRKDK
jgi:sucrose-6-phosphate hydrolase SacC (GH32 family)